jgi:hypothetical protein
MQRLQARVKNHGMRCPKCVDGLLSRRDEGCDTSAYLYSKWRLDGVVRVLVSSEMYHNSLHM